MCQCRKQEYTFESMWHTLINITPWDRGYKKECIWISHTITVLAALFENGNPWYGRTFICENSSFVRLQCTEVPYRVTSAIMWLCPTTRKSCKGIRKWKRLNCQHTLKWTFCVLWQRHVSSYNLTEHEQRQVLESKGISRAYRICWVCSALNFMTGYKMPKIHAR